MYAPTCWVLPLLLITSAALVAEYFPDDRGKAFGIYKSLKGPGYVLGPIIGGGIDKVALSLEVIA